MSNWGIESYDIKLRYIFAGKNSKLNKKFFGQKACSLREITLKGRHLVQIYTNCLLLYHKLSISALLRILLRREHLKEKWGKRSQGEILRQPRSGDFSNAHYPTSKLLPPPPPHKNSNVPHRIRLHVLPYMLQYAALCSFWLSFSSFVSREYRRKCR